jgi:uncharacterized NAD-dependent epimerase/dehydratase family protein
MDLPFPYALFLGDAVNTSKVSEKSALDYLAAVGESLQLPCCDPVRTGVGAIVDRLSQEYTANAAA